MNREQTLPSRFRFGSRQLIAACFVASVACFSGTAHGAAATHVVDFKGVLMGNSADETFTLGQSFTDPNSSSVVNFDVVVTLDWIDSSGASVSGLTGMVFGNAGGLGANTRDGLSTPDTGAVEEVAAASGPAFERLTFTVANVTPGATFVGYSNPVIEVAGGASSGTTEFSIVPGVDGYRIGAIEANFDTQGLGGTDPQAVPEPATWMTFCLITGLIVVAFRGQRKALCPTV
jgi:hypothetical protein